MGELEYWGLSALHLGNSNCQQGACKYYRSITSNAYFAYEVGWGLEAKCLKQVMFLLELFDIEELGTEYCFKEA